MYIDFDDYPTYTAVISDCFEPLLMPILSDDMATLIQPSKASRWHRLAIKVGKILNIFSPGYESKQIP